MGLRRSPIEGLEAPTKAIFRDRVLSDDELKAVLVATLDAETYGKFVRMLAYTGMRRGEVALMERAWIDGNIIVIPAQVAKNGREHRFPFGEVGRGSVGNVARNGLALSQCIGQGSVFQFQQNQTRLRRSAHHPQLAATRFAPHIRYDIATTWRAH